MSPTEFALAHGWRFIGEKRLKEGGTAKFFDHPEHQHDWGMFTATDAARHQKEFMKNGTCDCIKPEKRR